MTKEEMLKQEAEEWLNKWELCNKCDHKVQCIEDNAMCPQVVERAYLASAEPREKQITGLSKHILELQKDKGSLIDRCRELEAQIEKMKCCKEEIIKALKETFDYAWLPAHNGKAKFVYLQTVIDIVIEKFEEIKEK